MADYAPVPEGRPPEPAPTPDLEDPVPQYHPLRAGPALWGHPGHLTGAQSRALGDLADMVKLARLDLAPLGRASSAPITTLCRFLRARDFQPKAAFTMLREDLAWREANDVEALRRQTAREVLSCSEAEAQEFYPHLHHGFDRQGRPVFYEQCGAIDVAALFKRTTRDAFLRYHAWTAEAAIDLMHAKTVETGYQVDEMVVVIDIHGMSLRQVTKSFLALVKAFSEIDQAHYAERMGSLFIIRCPSMFGFVWSGIKPWLDVRTTSKIKIFTNNYKEALLEVIDAAEVPQEYGGTGGPLGSSLSASASAEESKSDSESESESDDDAWFDAHADAPAEAHGWNEELEHAMLHAAHEIDAAERDSPSALAEADAGEPHWLKPSTWPVKRLQRSLLRVNVIILLLSVMTISFGAFTRSTFYWTGGLVAWGSWLSLISIFLGVFLLVISVGGLLGAQYNSRPVLLIYTASLGVVSSVLFSFACVSFTLREGARAVIDVTWDTLRDTLPEDTSKESVVRTAEQYQLMLAVGCLITSIASAAPCFLAIRLRRRIQLEQDSFKSVAQLLAEEERWLRLVLQVANLATAVLAAVSVGYGAHALYLLESGMSTPYLLVVFGIVLAFAAVLGYRASKVDREALLRFYSWGLSLFCVVLVICGAVSFAQVSSVDDSVTDNWDSIEPLLKNDDLSEADVKDAAKDSLIVIGIIMMMTALLQLVALYSAVQLRRQLLLPARAMLLSAAGALPRGQAARPASSTERWIIAWGLLSGCCAIFWEGEYAIFHSWIHETTKKWFLQGWVVYGRADARFYESDAFIVASEGASALIVGPLCFLVAWAMYMTKPYRDVVTVVACTMQVHASILYLATEIHERGSHLAPVDDIFYFWTLFVMLNVLRTAVPAVIGARSVAAIIDAVTKVDTAIHDDALLEAQRRQLKFSSHLRRVRRNFAMGNDFFAVLSRAAATSGGGSAAVSVGSSSSGSGSRSATGSGSASSEMVRLMPRRGSGLDTLPL